MTVTRVAIATPLPRELRELITDVDPGVDLLVDDDLLPPMMHPGDHNGDPAYRRTPAQQQAFDDLLAQADILYGIPDVNPSALAAAVRANPNLRWVHTMAAGGGSSVKAAGLTEGELARVRFTTSAGVHGGTLAEFAVFGVLAGAKDLPRLLDLQESKVWPGRWAMRQVSEQTVLVVGLGGIGQRTATLLKGLGARVVGVKRTPEPVDNVDEVRGTDDLAALAAVSDAIVVTLPGTAATDGVISREVLQAAKPGVVVVNVGRGTTIDEPALIDALRSGQVSSAYLDVFATEPLPTESPLWSMRNVVIAPHTAALNPAEDRRIAELFADNLRRYLDGAPLRNLVDTKDFY